MKIRTVLLMGAEESASEAQRLANRIYGRRWRQRNPGATTERVNRWRLLNVRTPEKRDPSYSRAYYYRTHERRRQLENERRKLAEG